MDFYSLYFPSQCCFFILCCHIYSIFLIIFRAAQLSWFWGKKRAFFLLLLILFLFCVLVLALTFWCSRRSVSICYFLTPLTLAYCCSTPFPFPVYPLLFVMEILLFAFASWILLLHAVVLPCIPDPTFFHPGSLIRIFSIPDPGSASKNLSILTQKEGFLSSRKYDFFGLLIPDLDPRSRSRNLTFYRSRIPNPRSSGQKGTGSQIRSATLPACWLKFVKSYTLLFSAHSSTS